MTKKPLGNALLATLYIILIASGMYYGKGYVNPVDNVFMPMAMLSLLTLSAAVMGYLFFLQPVLLYLDGDKRGAVSLFLRTIGSFAVITLILFVIIFSFGN